VFGIFENYYIAGSAIQILRRDIMGIYIYTLIGNRDIKGTEVFKANFSQRLSNVGMDSRDTINRKDSLINKQADRFNTAPLFVFDFKHLALVYKKVNCDGYFYDSDNYGDHYGWLIKIGRAYQVITIAELDAHVQSMSAFNTFAALIEKTGSHYRPTIRARDSHMNVVLADIFDHHYNESGPWVDPETNEISKHCQGWDKQTNSAWKAQTQAYRG
jgi:small nuclear ribonucleoprotein (snRNP)-like protein